MPEDSWGITYTYGKTGLGESATGSYTVHRSDGSLVGLGLTKDEAYQVANCREAVSALGDLWEAVHREDADDFDTKRVRTELGAAFDVLMKAKGVKA